MRLDHGGHLACLGAAPVLPASHELRKKNTMPRRLTILGIESSCDDTAAAVVQDDRAILSSVVADQTSLHSAYGGVVPEIAARAHVEKLDFTIESALTQANLALSDLDAIAVTAGPGLIGGVLSGVMMARGLALGAGLPVIGVNHLAGHALTPRLTNDLAFPYLMLLVSGGHCQFLIVDGPDDFDRLGGTIDDAPGEAFDKTARLLGLPQPGGPFIEREATNGDPSRFGFPRPLLSRPGCDMSFSGLKTAILRERDRIISENGGLTTEDRADLCASFQAAIADVLSAKSQTAIELYLARMPSQSALTVAGGVAANKTIGNALKSVAADAGLAFIAPPLSLCTDNAAMIAWAGLELHKLGHPGMMPLIARPRWPLDESRPALLGSGKKGPKA